jgi:ubiquinone/menaquinone biosynthesis C-methylase UbiE
MIRKLIEKFYNEKIEDLCTRLLYFFNTIDSFFLFAAFFSFFLCATENYSIQWFILFGVVAILAIFISDFHPIFIAFSFPHVFFLFYLLEIPFSLVLTSGVYCLGITIATQFLFMGLPDSIVGRDIRIPFIKVYNSLTTIAPTTCSVPITLFFSWLLCINLLGSKYAAVVSLEYSIITLLSIGIAAGLTWFFRPQTYISKFKKIPSSKEHFRRVVIMNIDGCRFDHFKSLDLPTARGLEVDGTSVENGAITVYRALTNPAFASILTACPPTIHGVKNNNFGQRIQTQGIPDIVSTILYGSMHVKHFSKDEWETKIVSLPTTSIYGCDEVMVKDFKEDFEKREDVRLFVLDFSEADFLGHAYGSNSKNYKSAIQRVDKRIGGVVDWLRKDERGNDTAIIVCSDHGMYNIDHSYLLFDEEKYVPFIIEGKGIAKGKKVKGDVSIMDIGLTTCYLLGVSYPLDSKGRVLIEAIEGSNSTKSEEKVSSLFNEIHHDLEASDYDLNHPEIILGDCNWYVEQLKHIGDNSNGAKMDILDFGCGTGFVSRILSQNIVYYSKLVCLDSSSGMLEIAKAKLDGIPNLTFVKSLDEIAGDTFDLITINSVLHHFPYPEQLIKTLEGLLKPGGKIIGGHEPNIDFTNNSLAMFAAKLYKKLGGAVAFPKDSIDDFNERLKKKWSGFPTVDQEEIQQIVDWHSPTEQNREDIAKGIGLEGKSFLVDNLKFCTVQCYEEYTTFFYRQGLEKIPIFSRLFEMVYRVFFPGNLFRYIVCKKDK